MKMAFTWMAKGNDSVGSTRLATGVRLRVVVVRTARDLTVGKTAFTQISTTARSTSAELPCSLTLFKQLLQWLTPSRMLRLLSNSILTLPNKLQI